VPGRIIPRWNYLLNSRWARLPVDVAGVVVGQEADSVVPLGEAVLGPYKAMGGRVGRLDVSTAGDVTGTIRGRL
jgi:hypothetical protein